jgi:hypothetical protein
MTNQGLKNFKIELIGDTEGYIHHCEANNVEDAVEAAIVYHHIDKKDIISIYVTERYWRKATKEDF